MLSPRRRRLAGAEHGPRVLQGLFNLHNERMRAAENAPRDPVSILERRNGFLEIIERGVVVLVKGLGVIARCADISKMRLSEHTLRHGNCFAQQFPGFFETL